MWKADLHDKKADDAHTSIIQAAQRLKNTVGRLAALINNKYLEIDLIETSNAAWRDYLKFESAPFVQAEEETDE